MNKSEGVVRPECISAVIGNCPAHSFANLECKVKPLECWFQQELFLSYVLVNHSQLLKVVVKHKVLVRSTCSTFVH